MSRFDPGPMDMSTEALAEWRAAHMSLARTPNKSPLRWLLHPVASFREWLRGQIRAELNRQIGPIANRMSAHLRADEAFDAQLDMYCGKDLNKGRNE